MSVSEYPNSDFQSDVVVEHFKAVMEADPSLSEAVAAIKTLLQFMRDITGGTIIGLVEEIRKATRALKDSTSTVSVASGCELFVRFITLTKELEQANFQDLKERLIERGTLYLQKVANSRQRIAQVGCPFIRDGTTILIHSCSRVVFQLLQTAAASKKRLKIFITTCSLDCSGRKMQEMLEKSNIPSKLILDSAVGYIIEKVDLVIVGAEGVAESGGIINKIGTFQLAVLAKALNKPFYVVAESFKFVRMFPLKQDDLPNAEKYTAVDSDPDSHPHIDYTPPQYINLLFTDLGVLTPSAVSDELIKLYY